MRRLQTIDLSAAQGAFEAKDSGAFAAAIEPLGIDLAFEPLLGYVQRVDRSKYVGSLVHALLEQAYIALHDPVGFGFTTWMGHSVLVVRAGDRLVLGVQIGRRSRPFPKDGWTIGRWYKDPVRNRPTVEAWAADPAREADAMTVRITRHPEALAQSGDTRGDALLEAVIADPDDAAARLVYADWLSEQGDVRGELIRVQCDLQSGVLDDQLRIALRARERALLQHARAIVAPVAAFAERVDIGRGLVEDVTMRVVKLAKHGPELLAKHPIQRMRVLVSGPPELRRLGTLTFLSRLPMLSIEGRRTPKILMSSVRLDLSTIATSSIFAATRRLTLAYVDDPDDEWTRFFTTLVAPKLDTLVLVAPQFQPAVIASIAALRTLRSLMLDHPGFARGDTPVEPVVDAMRALVDHGLPHVVFHSWHVGDAVMGRCISTLAPTITNLQLHNCTIAERTIEALATAHRLELLALTMNRRWGLDLTAAIAAACSLPALRELVLDDDLRDPAQLETITRALCKAPPTLRVVRWTETALSDEQRARIRERRRLVRHHGPGT